MKRAENCVNAQVAHIQFCNDSLVFEFAKSKGHQDGEEHVGPWHVYANPEEPHICPVLALARYLFMYPETFGGSRPLFEGTDEYNRYHKIFHEMVNDNLEELKEMGVEKGDLGTHSARKGVGTWVTAGCTVGPPIVSVCVRMGWAMGGVKDRYLKLSAAGDQYTGRCAAGLDVCSKKFGISNPYFDFSSLSGTEKQQRQNELKRWLDARLCTKESSNCTVSGPTRYLATQLFASICYHHDFLNENLHQQSPFRASPFFSQIPLSLRSIVRVAYPWDYTEDSPTFTGIPPHVTLLSQMEILQEELKGLKESINETIVGELNKRGIGSNGFFTQRLEDMMKNLQSSLISEMSQLRTNGINMQQAVPELDDDADAYDLIDEVFEGGVAGGVNNTAAAHSREDSTYVGVSTSQPAKKKSRAEIHVIGGKLTPLHQEFQFPTMTCNQLVHNWFIGNSNLKSIPYRKLTPSFLEHVKNGKANKQKMGRFMAVVEFYARIEGCWNDNPTAWDVENVSEMWNAVANKHIYSKYSGSGKNASRSVTATWRSMLNKFERKGAFRKSRANCKSDEEWELSIYNTTAQTNTTS